MALSDRITEILENAYNKVTGKLKAEVDLSTGDIEIGAVEIKNATTDTRAVVNANGGLLTAIDQTTANANEVVAKPTGKQASATITLAAGVGAHSAGDVISTEAGAILSFASLGTAGDLIYILGSKLRYTGAAVPTASTGYKLHLYNASPTAIADNAAYNLPAADLAKYIGSIPISTLVDLGDTCAVNDENINFSFKLVGTGIYGILQCVAGETPEADKVITIVLNTVAI